MRISFHPTLDQDNSSSIKFNLPSKLQSPWNKTSLHFKNLLTIKYHRINLNSQWGRKVDNRRSPWARRTMPRKRSMAMSIMTKKMIQTNRPLKPLRWLNRFRINHPGTSNKLTFLSRWPRIDQLMCRMLLYLPQCKTYIKNQYNRLLKLKEQARMKTLTTSLSTYSHPPPQGAMTILKHPLNKPNLRIQLIWTTNTLILLLKFLWAFQTTSRQLRSKSCC